MALLDLFSFKNGCDTPGLAQNPRDLLDIQNICASRTHEVWHLVKPILQQLLAILVTKPESCNVYTLVGTKFLHCPLAPYEVSLN